MSESEPEIDEELIEQMRNANLATIIAFIRELFEHRGTVYIFKCPQCSTIRQSAKYDWMEEYGVIYCNNCSWVATRIKDKLSPLEMIFDVALKEVEDE